MPRDRPRKTAQLPRADRLGHAHDVLSNDDDIKTLAREVEAMHQQYLGAADMGR